MHIHTYAQSYLFYASSTTRLNSALLISFMEFSDSICHNSVSEIFKDL